MTKQQKKFADEYLIDANATQAAIRAGYSKRSAYSQGQRLLKKDEVAAYIENELSKMHNDKIMDAEEVMEYLSSVARGEQTEQTVRFCGSGLQEVVDIDVSAKDRLHAAELIGKRYGLFKENVNLGETRVVISTDVPEDW